jgi:hypothetical protein
LLSYFFYLITYVMCNGNENPKQYSAWSSLPCTALSFPYSLGQLSSYLGRQRLYVNFSVLKCPGKATLIIKDYYGYYFAWYTWCSNVTSFFIYRVTYKKGGYVAAPCTYIHDLITSTLSPPSTLTLNVGGLSWLSKSKLQSLRDN